MIKTNGIKTYGNISSSWSSLSIIIIISIIVIINHYQPLSTLSSPSQWCWSLNISSPHQHALITTWSPSSFIVTIFNTSAQSSSITVTVTVHGVTITYWLAFTTYTEKYNDQNFHPSLSSKHYGHGHLLHEPHNVRWKATCCAKHPNYWSNCWMKLVLNKAHLKKSWKYLDM